MDLHLKGRRALVTGSTAGIHIASPLASATTGAALRVDGGVVKSAF
jgi:enoyl-[acyl-carrier-protein] reductase (NADH)